MGSEYLLDSNIIIGYLAGKIPVYGMEVVSAIVNRIPRISVISQIEVMRFNDTPENENILKNFINASIIYPLSPNVVIHTIQICKRNRIKLPDAIIAATALSENLILVTRNIDDFTNIRDLEMINPWDKTSINQ